MQPLVGPCHISASCFSVISGVIIYFFFNLVRTDLVWGLNGKCLDASCLFFECSEAKERVKQAVSGVWRLVCRPDSVECD